MDDNKRLMAALVLCLGILISWQMLFPPTPIPETEESSESSKAPNLVSIGYPIIEAAVAIQRMESKPTDSETEKITLAEHRMKTDRFLMTLTNEGARLKSYELTEPKQYIPKKDYIGSFPDDNTSFRPFSISFGNDVIPLKETDMFSFISDESELSEDGDEGNLFYNKVVYKWISPDGAFEIVKTYEIGKLAYNIELTIEIRRKESYGHSIKESLNFYVYGYRDPSQGSRGLLNPMPNVTEGICLIDDDVEREEVGDIEEDKPSFSGAITWGGVDDRYFLFAAIPRKGSLTECHMELKDDDFLQTTLSSEKFQLDPNGELTFSFSLFLGPKDMDFMEDYEVKLDKSVDYWIVGFLCYPIRWLLINFYSMVGNWGIAVILLTILIKLLLFPLTQKSFKSMEKMKQVQPKMKALQEKYKNDRTRMSEETMKLYREENVSPFGCLPMFLQMPIYLAL